MLRGLVFFVVLLSSAPGCVCRQVAQEAAPAAFAWAKREKLEVAFRPGEAKVVKLDLTGEPRFIDVPVVTVAEIGTLLVTGEPLERAAPRTLGELRESAHDPEGDVLARYGLEPPGRMTKSTPVVSELTVLEKDGVPSVLVREPAGLRPCEVVAFEREEASTQLEIVAVIGVGALFVLAVIADSIIFPVSIAVLVAEAAGALGLIPQGGGFSGGIRIH